MKRRTTGFWAVGVSALLLAGCSDDKQDAAKPVVKQEAIKPVVEPSATEKAKSAVEDATSKLKSAAGAVAEQVGEKTVSAREAVTEVTAEVVEKTANKVSEVAAAVESAVAPVASGESTYKSLCFSCHDNGLAGAPKLADKAAWEPRIASGLESMYSSAINGKGAMPGKGGNPGLSDAEVKATVDYMLSTVN